MVKSYFIYCLFFSISFFQIPLEFEETELLIVENLDDGAVISAKRELTIKMMRLILIEAANNEDEETIKGFFEQ